MKKLEITNRFTVKKMEIDVLERLFSFIDDEEKNIKQEYVFSHFTDEPRKHWKTGEVLTDNEGNIRYEEVWEYKDKEELTDNDRDKLIALNNIRTLLETAL